MHRGTVPSNEFARNQAVAARQAAELKYFGELSDEGKELTDG
jgi:hypothetical protein